jgi:hypothetical protein
MVALQDSVPTAVQQPLSEIGTSLFSR